MSYGPVELVVVRFDGTDFKGEVLREIQKAVDAGTIRVIDILVAVRLGDEPLKVLEITELQDPVFKRWEPMIADAGDLLSEADAYALSADLGPDAAVALMLFEHRWIAPIADAIEGAGGHLVMNERIPRSVVEQLVAEAETA